MLQRLVLGSLHRPKSPHHDATEPQVVVPRGILQWLVLGRLHHLTTPGHDATEFQAIVSRRMLQRLVLDRLHRFRLLEANRQRNEFVVDLGIINPIRNTFTSTRSHGPVVRAFSRLFIILLFLVLYADLNL